MEDIEETIEKKKIGLGGWLVFVQSLMLAGFLYHFFTLQSNIENGSLLRIVALSLLIVLIVISIVQYYRYKIMFRISFLCYVVVAIIYFYLLSNFAGLSAGELAFGTICMFGMAIVVVLLFVSKRVNNTFCEQSIKDIKQLKQKNPPIGLDGWLLLVQLWLVLSIAGIFLEYTNIIIKNENIDVLNIAIESVFLVLIIICSVLFYRRKIAFRKFFIIAMVISQIEAVVNRINDYQDIEGWFAMLLSLTIVVFIIVTLYKSERVKNTFS